MFVVKNLNGKKHDFISRYIIRNLHAESDVNNYLRTCTFYLLNWSI